MFLLYVLQNMDMLLVLSNIFVTAVPEQFELQHYLNFDFPLLKLWLLDSIAKGLFDMYNNHLSKRLIACFLEFFIVTVIVQFVSHTSHYKFHFLSFIIINENT